MSAVEVRLPVLGENVEQATVSTWLKKVGDPIALDEPLLEVTTDKVDTEIPSPVEGTLAEVFAAEDDLVEVGQLLATVEPTVEPTAAPPPTPEARVATAPAEVTEEPGAGQAVTKSLSRLRKVIAARMVDSLQTSAQLTTVVEVDVSLVAAARATANREFEAQEGFKLSFLPFFAKAALDALREHPTINSSIDLDAGTVTYPGAEHLGVAVDTERGLYVPIIRDAGQLSVREIARAVKLLAERTRDGSITADDLAGGTFTITNTGSRGALFDTPIINQPQVAILGTGTVVKRSVVVTDGRGQDSTAIRPMAYFSLTYDHRIVDGADAARFLTCIKASLEGIEMEVG